MSNPIFWIPSEDLEEQEVEIPAQGWTPADVPGKIFTLVFVVDERANMVLLGDKKRGFGKGILNGFGGKVEQGESVLEGARRELEEESGLLGSLDYKGRLIIFLPQAASGIASAEPRVQIDIALFVCRSWNGMPKETEEMAPEWHPIDDIPFTRMAPLYIPLVWSSPRQLAIRVEYDGVGGQDRIVGWSTALHA